MKVSDIKLNPDNPRTIKDENFKKLVQSIKDFPEMLDARPLVLNKDNVILGGNMRFKASKEAGLKEVPVKIVDWSEEKQREFIIKDNISGGDWDWDLLANEWDVEDLEDWGLTVKDWDDKDTPEHNGASDETNLEPYTLYITSEEADRLRACIIEGLDIRASVRAIIQEYENTKT